MTIFQFYASNQYQLSQCYANNKNAHFPSAESKIKVHLQCYVNNQNHFSRITSIKSNPHCYANN